MKSKPTVYVITVIDDYGITTRLVVGCFDLAAATVAALDRATNVVVGEGWDREAEVPFRGADELARARNLIALVAAPVNLPVHGGQS